MMLYGLSELQLQIPQKKLQFWILHLNIIIWDLFIMLSESWIISLMKLKEQKTILLEEIISAFINKSMG